MRTASSADEPTAEDRLRLIEGITDVGVALQDVEDVLTDLLDRVCEALGVDTGAVLLLDARSGELVATAARGIEEEVRQGLRIPLHQGFAGRIAAEKRPVVLDRVDATTVISPHLVARGIQSLLGVPLLEGGEVVGVLHVGTHAPRRFTDEDVSLLQVVADRITSATRPRIAASERQATLALQRGLLPHALPDIAGLGLASRYVPGGGNAVGGDWYDVLRLGGGWVGLVIGDVSGHGLHAAVIMGRVRSALRAYAIETRDPADVLSRLDNKLQHFEAGEMATVLYAVVEPSLEQAHVSCAGHLPPLLTVPDGESTRFLDLPVDPPLGVRLGFRRHATSVPIPPGARLCFYTDGLVEERGTPIDVGLERLRATAGGDTAEATCATIMSGLVGSSILEDDVALLVVERLAVDEQAPLELRLTAEPPVLAHIRSAARQWLRSTGADADEVDEVLLAVGEATSNVVEHAYGPEGGELHVRFERDGSTLTVTVRDHGRWRAPRGTDRGRGAALMEHCSDEVRVDRTPGGTKVTLVRTLRSIGGGS